MTRKKIFSIIIILLFHSLALFFILSPEERLPPNTFFGSRNISGFSRKELQPLISEELKAREMKIYTFVFDAEIRAKRSMAELGLSYNDERTVSHIFSMLPAWYRFFPTFSLAESQKTVFLPEIDLNAFLFSREISALVLPEKKDPLNATIVRRGNAFLLQEDIPGTFLTDDELRKLSQAVIRAARDDQSEVYLSPKLSLIEAERKRSDLVALFSELQNFIQRPIIFTFGKEKKEIDVRQHEDALIIDFDAMTFFWNPAFLHQMYESSLASWEKSSGGILITGIREETSEYDKEIVKRAVMEGDFRHGIALDQEKIRKELDALLIDPKRSRTIEIPLKESFPKIVSSVPGYQFDERLSMGVTSFRLGNYPARVKNIKLSLAALQNVVIDPQEEVSFNRLTGFITREKGYTMTKIIVDGEVKEGLGGGVCQTSTTLFRTILNAGLPTTERRNHSIDVSYYHQYGYGLDATVYTESRQDLRFKNDYAFPILVHAFTDDEKSEAFVEFYGLKKERIVELTEVKTGRALYKKWNWNITFPDKKEERIVESWYIPPKEKKEPINPLES